MCCVCDKRKILTSYPKGRKPSTSPAPPTSPSTGLITIFVIDVTVTSASSAGAAAGQDAGADAGAGVQQRSWTLRKRYTDFKALHGTCVAQHLGDELSLPRKSKGTQTDEMLAARQLALNAYLENLCGRRQMPAVMAKQLQLWLGCDGHGFDPDQLLWPSASA